MFEEIHPSDHGGRLRHAAHTYRISARKWLDLSTGINPLGWPVPTMPPEVWQRLPEDEDGLYMATTAYFASTAVLPVAGSQAAIQALPRLRAPGRVGVIAPTYAEHARAWSLAGHAVEALAIDAVDAALNKLDVLIVVNPNNPTGSIVEPEKLLEWHRRLATRAGWLIVDEAFIELQPSCSVASAAFEPGLIVLRSLGKFWGLAGLRAGFALAEPGLLSTMREQLGPWQLSHPARWVAQRALMDQEWIGATRTRLQRDGERLAEVLAAHGWQSPSGCGLFRWVPTQRAAFLHDALARQAVLVRKYEDGMRVGLPGDESGWHKLEAALIGIRA